MIKPILRSCLELGDRIGAAASPGLFSEGSTMLSMLFHSLFRTRSEIDRQAMDPQQGLTVADFKILIEYFLECGYCFLRPEDIGTESESRERCILITFDDGYYNNHLALDVLKEFRVPAVFYVSTDYVLEGKSFWWDVHYREMRMRGIGSRARGEDLMRMKRSATETIEAELADRYGKAAMRPKGDLDRPFNPGELAAFAREELVVLGNHTANHAILTNYSDAEAKVQIRKCQDALEGIAGYRPSSIAYPNGNFSKRIVDIALQEGLATGFTLAYHRNNHAQRLGRNRMALGRFLPHAKTPMETQCRIFRSGLAPSHLLRRIFKVTY